MATDFERWWNEQPVMRWSRKEAAEAAWDASLARASQEDYHAANLALHKRIAELERVHADALEQWAKAEEALKASSATASSDLMFRVRAVLARQWEKSNEGAFGPLAKLIAEIDAAIGSGGKR